MESKRFFFRGSIVILLVLHSSRAIGLNLQLKYLTWDSSWVLHENKKYKLWPGTGGREVGQVRVWQHRLPDFLTFDFDESSSNKKKLKLEAF